MHDPAGAPGARSALCLYNPLSSNGATAAEAARDAFVDCGLATTLLPLDSTDPARFLADRAAEFGRIVVCGGDGTIHALLPPLLEVGKPLGVIPAGTANDFARSLGLPDEPEAACRIIAAGHTRAVDIGFVGERPFVNAVQIGMAAEVARHHEGWHKKWLGVFGYPISWLKARRAARPFSADIEVDGTAQRVRADQVTIGGGRCYGGGMVVDEAATLDDGRLRLVCVKPVPLIEWAWLFPRLRRGSRTPETVHLTARRVVVRTSRPVRLSVDGELAGTTPAVVTIEPRRLRVYAPAEDAQQSEEMDRE